MISASEGVSRSVAIGKEVTRIFWKIITTILTIYCLKILKCLESLKPCSFALGNLLFSSINKINPNFGKNLIIYNKEFENHGKFR